MKGCPNVGKVWWRALEGKCLSWLTSWVVCWPHLDIMRGLVESTGLLQAPVVPELLNLPFQWGKERQGVQRNSDGFFEQALTESQSTLGKKEKKRNSTLLPQKRLNHIPNPGQLQSPSSHWEAGRIGSQEKWDVQGPRDIFERAGGLVA